MNPPTINATIAAAIEPVVEAVVAIERQLEAGHSQEAIAAAAINVGAAESAILAAISHFAYD